MTNNAHFGNTLAGPPAFNPETFERFVQEAATPPDFKAHLLRFIQRHAPGVKVVIGPIDGFCWHSGVLMLTRETATGEGMRSLLVTAHEVAHSHQKEQWPWLPWWALKVPLVRMFLEVDSWRRALRMLS